jgi:hypothetical protein
MAADGSRWQFLERTPSRLAPRDVIDSDDQVLELSPSADSRRAIQRHFRATNCTREGAPARKIDDLAMMSGGASITELAIPRRGGRKIRKIVTTDRPLAAAELELKPPTNSM